jgi:RNA polymerase sigma-70 factor (ECF subfamily)
MYHLAVDSWRRRLRRREVVATVEPPADPDGADRFALRHALVQALAQLPPRQRAVLVLREVLRLRAAEVAEMLGTSVAAVNSSLQRARAQLDAAGLTEEDVAEPDDPRQRELLDRYARALETKDVAAIVEVFTADVVWEMPPFSAWFRGPEAIARLIATHCPAKAGELRLVPTEANGQPAYAVYRLTDEGWMPFQLHVLALTDGRVSHVAAFFDLSLFATFGLPARLDDVAPGVAVA